MQVTGTLKKVFDTQVISDKFRKRDFVLTIDAATPYPQHLLFQATQDKCNIFDSFNDGDEVTVSFNLRGREWINKEGQVKYFNTLEAWRVELAIVNNGATQPPSNTTAHYSSELINDDLPF